MAARLRALRHALPVRRLETRLARRGPQLAPTTGPDLGFNVAAGGVMLGATILGVVLGVAHPTWMLAAALLGAGALLAGVVLLHSSLASNRPHLT